MRGGRVQGLGARRSSGEVCNDTKRGGKQGRSPGKAEVARSAIGEAEEGEEAQDGTVEAEDEIGSWLRQKQMTDGNRQLADSGKAQNEEGSKAARACPWRYCRVEGGLAMTRVDETRQVGASYWRDGTASVTFQVSSPRTWDSLTSF